MLEKNLLPAYKKRRPGARSEIYAGEYGLHGGPPVNQLLLDESLTMTTVFWLPRLGERRPIDAVNGNREPLSADVVYDLNSAVHVVVQAVR